MQQDNETSCALGLDRLIEGLVDRTVTKYLVDWNGRPKSPRDLRIEAGMELSQVAREAGVSSGWLSNIERGKCLAPSIEKMNAVASVLGVNCRAYREACTTAIREARHATQAD